MAVCVCINVSFGFEAFLDPLVVSSDDRWGASALSPPIDDGCGLGDIDRVRCGETTTLEVDEATSGVCISSEGTWGCGWRAGEEKEARRNKEVK